LLNKTKLKLKSSILVNKMKHSVRRRSRPKRQRSKSRKSKTRRSRFARSANNILPTAKFGGSVLSHRRRSSPRRRAASSLHTPSPHTDRVNVMYTAQGYLRPPSGSSPKSPKSPKSPSPWTMQHYRIKGAQKYLGRPGHSHSLS